MYVSTLTPLYTLLSLSVTGACLFNAYVVQSDYDLHAAITYIFASRVSLIIIAHLLYVLLFVLGGSGMAFFIGKIRKKEFEKFQERMVQYSAVNLLFVFYVMNSSTLYSTLTWITWFTAIGFFKVFSIIAKERSRYYMSSLVNDNSRHKKLFGLLVVIIVADLLIAGLGVLHFYGAGIGFVLLSLYECWILLIETVQTLIKYGVYLYYDYFGASLETAWEGRHEFCYFTEFALECVRLISMMSHYVHIWVVDGFSLSIIDLALFMLANSAFNELRGHLHRLYEYWIVRETINNTYPTATEEELKEQETCSICYETMSKGGQAKKIKCGHIYHLICIKQWMQQSNTCPVCREPLLKKGENEEEDENHHHHGNPELRRRTRNQSSSWTSWLPFSVELLEQPDTTLRAPTPETGDTDVARQPLISHRHQLRRRQ